MLGWYRYGFEKKRARTCDAELVFLYPVGSAGHVVHFDVSGERNMISLFFMHRYDQYGFNKKRIGTRYAEYVFLYLVGTVGHIVHSGVSGARNINAVFFLLGWA
jgi:hypothetical protein